MNESQLPSDRLKRNLQAIYNDLQAEGFWVHLEATDDDFTTIYITAAHKDPEAQSAFLKAAQKVVAEIEPNQNNISKLLNGGLA